LRELQTGQAVLVGICGMALQLLHACSDERRRAWQQEDEHRRLSEQETTRTNRNKKGILITAKKEVADTCYLHPCTPSGDSKNDKIQIRRLTATKLEKLRVAYWNVKL